VRAGFYTLPPSETGVLVHRFRYSVARLEPLVIVAEGLPRAVFCSVRI
jgi:hypothetical protein